MWREGGRAEDVEGAEEIGSGNRKEGKGEERAIKKREEVGHNQTERYFKFSG
jgi:hypothetical protein